MSNHKTPPNFLDLTGKKFGRLTIQSRCADVGKAKVVAWNCVCECGTRVIARSAALVHGGVKSCGCLRRQLVKTQNLTHGHTSEKHHESGKRRMSRTYVAWRSAITRCENPNNKRWEDYGGRGIRMCERWRNSFAAFLADMGECGPGMSIDRIDVDRGYEPGNCKWIPMVAQVRNRRCTKLSVEKAEEIRAERAIGHSLAVIAKKHGISKSLASMVCKGELWK